MIMGTDIHGVIQINKKAKWVTIEEGYRDRNYNAFAILADVRNGHGFAGILTSSGFKPIANPKGLPGDFASYNKDPELHPVSKNFTWGEPAPFGKLEKYTYWMGDHSHSYVSAEELLNIDWDEKVKRYGVIPEEIYLLREKNGITEAPENFSRHIMGQNIIVCSNEEYEDLVSKGDLPKQKEIYIRISWVETYAKAVGLDFFSFVTKMEKYALQYGNDNVRFVFGFDS